MGENEILTLMEMGFARDQAINALEATNNDLNKAIAFLFGEVDDNQGDGTESAPIDVDSQIDNSSRAGPYDNYPQSTISIRNPQDVPDFLSSNDSAPKRPAYHGSHGSFPSNLTEFIEHRYPNNPPQDSDSEDVNMDTDSSEDIGPNIKGPGHLTPIILSRIPGYRYWTPILSILVRNREFVSAVMASDDFSKRSFEKRTSEEEVESEVEEQNSEEKRNSEEDNGGSSKENSSKESSNESFSGQSSKKSFSEAKLSEQSTFLQELKKIIQFVVDFDKSTEWYICADELLKKIPASLMSDEYMMSEEEVLVNVFRCLMEKVPRTRPLLESFVESTEEEISKDLSVVEIDIDTRKTNVYETLNELFWQRGFTKLGLIKYQKIAPIVTLHLMGDESMYGVPFQVDEEFYPEIYGEKALLRIQEEVKRMEAADVERRKVSKELMDLNVFEGKRLSSLLRQSTEIVGQVSKEAGDDLRGFSEKLNDLRNENVKKQRELSEIMQGKRLQNFHEVIRDVGNLQKYTLKGVIFSESFYYIRDNGIWMKMDNGEIVDFDQVSSDVSMFTRKPTQAVTLVYTKEDDIHESE